MNLNKKKLIQYIYIVILSFFFYACAENNNESSLTITTWNIEWFPKNQNTIDLLAELIIEIDADVFGLQEITDTNHFNQLINKINDLDLINSWGGFRAGSENSTYQELAYIIKTSSININQNPYTILNQEDYYFAYREPYVIEISYMNHNFIIINNHFKCCGDGVLDNQNTSDEEYRRKKSSELLKNYVDENLSEEKVIIIGDLNDALNDTSINNVFNDFLNDSISFQFADMEIALGTETNWSYPDWPSHLDHIIITNELYDMFSNPRSIIQTIHVENYVDGGKNKYNEYISDHLPVSLQLKLNP